MSARGKRVSSSYDTSGIISEYALLTLTIFSPLWLVISFFFLPGLFILPRASFPSPWIFSFISPLSAGVVL